MKLQTPVIYLIFNRPDLTERSFETLRQARPAQLLVVADGPRSERPLERDLCAAARAVTERIDWPCEVAREYSDINLGCGRRVASGITKGFELFEEAIILEDDCLPDLSFFRFCTELLERYRHDTRVGHISGNNFQGGFRRGDADYYFSKYSHNWGWATWRRAWQAFNYDLRDWPVFREAGFLDTVCDSSDEKLLWCKNFNQAHAGILDNWDTQWQFACWKNSTLSIHPQVNLVSNVGFRAGDATHTHDPNSNVANLPVTELDILRHPMFVIRHRPADEYTFASVFRPVPQAPQLWSARNLLYRIRQKLMHFAS